MISLDFDRINTVSFDIGGVVAADYWEAMYFDNEVGLIAQLGTSEKKLQEVGSTLWLKYCRDEFSENEYWDEFGRLVGERPSRSQISIAEEAVWTDPSFAETIIKLRKHNVRVFITTDNTAFWLPKQLQKLRVDTLVSQKDIVTSWRTKVRKKSTPVGNYGILSRISEPSTTLVVEDRDSNLHLAEGEGFATCEFKGFRGSRIISVFDHMRRSAG